jgi:UDP-2-acetamido-3-amino-2,3-dideoxy-glucuronate N-acetyltransferase
MSDPIIHPTAIVEPDVHIGPGSRVWDNVHIRHGARLGTECIVGEKTYIAYGVRIGNCVKVNACVYICALVTIEDFVMISAHTVFTNDRFPRAFSPDLSGLATSDVTEETLPTIVRRGVTIGANATIGPGIEIGEFAMVGMGAVVTKNVPAHALIFGNPARLRGYVCVCGHPLGDEYAFDRGRQAHCERCARRFASLSGRVTELTATPQCKPTI